MNCICLVPSNLKKTASLIISSSTPLEIILYGLKLDSANFWYHLVHNVLSSHLLSKNVKILKCTGL
jgi:hypothetical protein